MPIKADWYPFESVGLAPKTPGVYEMGYRSNGAVVYVGSSTSSIHSRLIKHVERRDFVGVTNFRFRKTASDEAVPAERKLLLEYKKKHGRLPRFNDRLPPDDPYRY